jgi:hypothetical protein
VSDPRPPDDGPNWPERDLEESRTEEPGAGWSDDPYRYEPPPRVEPSYDLRQEGEAADERPPAEPELEAAEPAEPAEQAESAEPAESAESGAWLEPQPPPQPEPEPEPPPPPQPEPQPEPPPPPIESAEPITAFEGSAPSWNPKVHGNRRRPTTAEQAVPWLIGLILALAGMVIVLLALIFTSPDGLVAGQPTDSGATSPSALPSPDATSSGEPSSEPGGGSASPAASASASPSAQPTEGPTPTPERSYGPLEMVYLGRPSGVAPIYLLRRDFSVADDPEVMAQADQGVTAFAWSPDGQVGAAVIAGRGVALTPGKKARTLAEDVSALSFGWDSEVVYAVRITRDGANDRAQVLEIDFISGATDVLANIRYPHPVIGSDPPLREAQFIDEGGVVRIYAVADGNLAVWILGAPSAYRVDPADGTLTEITRQPTLWSPDGTLRVTLHENGGSTTLRLRDRGGSIISAVSISGLVSHVRWAETSNEVVFTVGRLSASGGVRQDLYVWNLEDRVDPLPLTSGGAAFGAEWRGVMPNWAP